MLLEFQDGDHTYLVNPKHVTHITKIQEATYINLNGTSISIDLDNPDNLYPFETLKTTLSSHE